MKLVLEVTNAQMYNGQLQLQVYAEDCEGESSYEFVDQRELVSFLNRRKLERE